MGTLNFNQTWQGTCVDVNPCLVNNGGCDPSALCADLPAPAPGFANSTGRTCKCGDGYYGDGNRCTAIIPIGSVRITFVFNISATEASNSTWKQSLINALATDTGRVADLFGVVSVTSNDDGQAVVVVGIASDLPNGIPATTIADSAIRATQSPSSEISQFPLVGQPVVSLPPTEKKKGNKALSDLSVVGIVLLVFFVSCVIFVTCWYFLAGDRRSHTSSQSARAKPVENNVATAASQDAEMAAVETGQGHQEDVSVQ
jgi:hypothetical protein